MGRVYVCPMDDRVPTVRSRELGDGLRAAMKKAGFNGKQIADKLQWSDTRVSRVLTGTRGAKEVDISAFLALCGVTGKERARLLRLCHEQHKPGWLQQHGSRMPLQVKTLVDHEVMAVAISEFQSTVMPGLLQTGDYARALFKEAKRVPSQEVDNRVALRLARQNLLSREDPPKFAFFIHEFVLHLPIGDSLVMSEQLHTLLRLAVRPSVTLRVVPASIGAHAATAGHFTLMEFSTYKPVVYLESETSCLFLEEPAEIAAYRSITAALETTALDERESKELIAKVATEKYPT